jgi:hypothetical protein
MFKSGDVLVDRDGTRWLVYAKEDEVISEGEANRTAERMGLTLLHRAFPDDYHEVDELIREIEGS